MANPCYPSQGLNLRLAAGFTETDRMPISNSHPGRAAGRYHDRLAIASPGDEVVPGEIATMLTSTAGRTCVWPGTTSSEPPRPTAQRRSSRRETTENSQLAACKRGDVSVILPQSLTRWQSCWSGSACRALRPLTRLRKTIDAREPDDLSPIANRQGLQKNSEPLVEAFNEMLARMRRNVEAQQRFIRRCRPPDADVADLRPENPGPFAIRETDPEALRHALRQIATGEIGAGASTTS